MINLLLIVPEISDGTSFYRAAGPLADIRKKFVDINIMSVGQYTEATMSFADIVFMQRPFIDQHVQQAAMAKARKIPLLIDYDDDLFSVGQDNFTADIYNQPGLQENIKKLCTMADCISVSTEALGKKIAKINPNVILVPNAVDTTLFKPMAPEIGRNKTILWRGSHTHFKDLIVHKEAILDIYKKYPEWKWFFAGYNAWFITEHMHQDRCFYAPFINNARQFIELLQAQRAAIHLVPLFDSEFNRSKSNVSKLEASIAGSATLVPDWEEFRGGEAFRYKDPADFHAKLEEMINTPLETLGEMANKDWEWVEKERSLDVINKTRIGILMSMLGLLKK
jgi:glycosyltransferase involved in cell wall biosynthesis